MGISDVGSQFEGGQIVAILVFEDSVIIVRAQGDTAVIRMIVVSAYDTLLIEIASGEEVVHLRVAAGEAELMVYHRGVRIHHLLHPVGSFAEGIRVVIDR